MIRTLFYFFGLLTVASFVATVRSAYLATNCVVTHLGEYTHSECDYRGFPGLCALTVFFALGAAVAAYVLYADEPRAPEIRVAESGE